MRKLATVLTALLLAAATVPATAVVNGKQVTGTQWSFLVAVGCSGASATDDCRDRLYGSDSLGMFTPQFCGGVLIRPRIVATAAHCMIRSNGLPFTPDDIYVGGGSPILGAMTRDVDVAGVDAIVIHPKYDKLRQTNDLALLVIKHELANTVTLPFVTSNAAVPESVPAAIAGWGDVDANGTAPMAANFAEIMLYPQSRCALELGSAFDPASMLCGGAQDDLGWIDACQGDSGGPLVADIAGSRTLIGLTSWGPACAKGSPGIYTRIGDLLNGLLQQVRAEYPVELERKPAAPVVRSVGRISRSGTAKVVFALQRDGQAVRLRSITCTANGRTVKTTTTGLVATVQSLRVGRTYRCTATARNAQGVSPWSKRFTLR